MVDQRPRLRSGGRGQAASRDSTKRARKQEAGAAQGGAVVKIRIFHPILALLVLIAVGLAGFLFVFMRPLPVEVVRTTDRVPVEVFGLGTVEARILSRVGFEVGAALRSEEHTSELQSIMRISYAVFCLKTKK